MMTSKSPPHGVLDVLAMRQAFMQLVQESSPLNILTKMTDIASRLTHARLAAAGILTPDGTWQEWAFSGSTQEASKRFFGSAPFRAVLTGLPNGGGTVQVDVPAPMATGPVRPVACVPVPWVAGLRGWLFLADREGAETFSDLEIQRVELLASLAGVAVENVRLLADGTELSQRNRELSIFNDVSVAASTTLELEGILATALDRMMLHFGALNGEVFLAEEENDRLRIALQRGNRLTSYWESDNFGLNEGFVGRVAGVKDLLALADPPSEYGFNADVFRDDGLRMLLGIPLLSKGRVLGVMILALREVTELTPRQKALFEAVGLSVGTAVENGLLHRKSQRLAVLEERERIGMDLHDGIIQSIYAVGLMLEECKLELGKEPAAARPKLERAIGGLNGVIRDIRAYINNLQPQRFIFENLAIGLELLVREFQINTPASMETSLSQEAARGLAPATANTLFHIAQEALANITRHAHATRVRLTLDQVEDRVVLEVADNGRGFDQTRRDLLDGHGLANMEERARGVRGELVIQSQPGEGTLVRVSIPRIRPQTGNLAGRLPKSGPLRKL
jgi:two-component system sensor histidine kinase DevS